MIYPDAAQLAKTEKVTRAGWRISEWCAAVGIGRSTFYVLGDRAPTSVKIATMHIVTESPADWLRRVGTA